VLEVLGANLPAGCKRLTESDLLPSQLLGRQGAAWYAIAPTASSVGVTLSLERLGESRLRGGGTWFAGPPELTVTPRLAAAWEQVMRFLDDGIVPVARAVGAEVCLPTSEEVFFSDLPFDVGGRLRELSRTARKSLPLNRVEADLWHGFVIAAFRTKAVIDALPFANWLVAEGWSREAADELHRQLVDQRLLLSRYVDKVFAA
jgi:hypothetical protein